MIEILVNKQEPVNHEDIQDNEKQRGDEVDDQFSNDNIGDPGEGVEKIRSLFSFIFTNSRVSPLLHLTLAMILRQLVGGVHAQGDPHTPPDQPLLHEPGEQQEEAEYESQSYIQPRVLVPWQSGLADTAVPVVEILYFQEYHCIVNWDRINYIIQVKVLSNVE